LNPSSELAELIIADVKRRTWAKDVQFVPMAWKYLEERRWQERPPGDARSSPERGLEGLVCMRPCPRCGETQEGRIQSGQKVFDPCGCALAKAGA
jgi:hypothetical protein